VKRLHVEAILNHGNLNALERLGDWFVLYQLTVNLNTLTVGEIIGQVGVGVCHLLKSLVS
jgi:hypothetical protein